MRRRTFIAALGGAAVWPVVARGQQPMRAIRFLGSRTAVDSALRVEAFRQTLSEAGYIEGQDATIDY